MSGAQGPAALLPLALRGIDKTFGRHAVLRGLDLDLGPGEVVGLVGANGAGKTTLFNLLLGLEHPDRGHMRFGPGEGRDEVDVELRGQIAHVAHGAQLYALLSGRENLGLFDRLRGDRLRGRGGPDGAGAADLEGAASALAELGFPERAVDRPAQTYSRGMLQRVALARALGSGAALLVLDEPFTALDAAGRGRLIEALRAARARGVSALLSSHDLHALSRIADRVLWLSEGRIAAELRGTSPDDLHAQVLAVTGQGAADAQFLL